jgi:hypothetical protein
MNPDNAVYIIGLYLALPPESKVNCRWPFRAITRDMGPRIVGFDAAEAKVIELNKALGLEMTESFGWVTPPGTKFFMFDCVESL